MTEQQEEPDPRAEARAISRLLRIMIGCFVAAILLNGGFTLWVNQQAKETARRQGVAIEAKICSTLDGLASLKPPPGNPETNPSRAYLQEEHAKLAQLGGDLGC